MDDIKKKEVLRDAERFHCLTNFMRDLLTGKRTGLDAKVVENTLQGFATRVRRLKNEESGRVTYWYKNGHDYKLLNGIKFGKKSGLRAHPTGLRDFKRGRINRTSRASIRRLKEALATHDLPNGSLKYFVTLATCHWDHWDMDKPNIKEDINKEFRKATKALGTAFTRCFNRCASIYRVEAKRGMPHLHIMFYTPLEYDWANEAYSYFAKMRKCRRQEIVDAGGKMPARPQGRIPKDFVHAAFQVLWYNAMRRRPIPKNNLPKFWKSGVDVEYVDEAAAFKPLQVGSDRNVSNHSLQKVLVYFTKSAQCWTIGKPWGYMRQKNLKKFKPKEISQFWDARPKLLARFWGNTRRGKPYPKKFDPTGIYIIENKETERLMRESVQTMRKHKRRRPPRPHNLKPIMTASNTPALRKYFAQS